jgi:DNA invertase Pin-like site-specific DNA recombinase
MITVCGKVVDEARPEPATTGTGRSPPTAKEVLTMAKPNPTKRVALYARVSTDGQTTDNQLNELRAIAQRHNCEIVEEFIDQGISGAKGRDKRPAFDRMCKAAVRKDFDLIAAWSVDRLGRSLQHLVTFLEELHAKDVGLYLHQQAVDTTIPAGRALFQMMGVFAEFERSMIHERVKAGLQRARRQGKRLGRPPVSPKTEEAIRIARNAGMGILKTAREVGVGVSVVQRVIRST